MLIARPRRRGSTVVIEAGVVIVGGRVLRLEGRRQAIHVQILELGPGRFGVAKGCQGIQAVHHLAYKPIPGIFHHGDVRLGFVRPSGGAFGSVFGRLGAFLDFPQLGAQTSHVINNRFQQGGAEPRRVGVL